MAWLYFLFHVVWLGSMFTIVQCRHDSDTKTTTINIVVDAESSLKDTLATQLSIIPPLPLITQIYDINDVEHHDVYRRDYTSWDKTEDINKYLIINKIIDDTGKTTINEDQALSSLQRSLIYDLCVYTENELRLKISDANILRIDLCSSNIKINATLPNYVGSQGILIRNKKLQIYCMTTEACILDAQYLSRMFYVVDSTLYFQNIIFMNSNASKDTGYKHGGVFYVSDSTIDMSNCSFINNIADYGGGIISFQSNISIINTKTSHHVIQNNKAFQDGGFHYASESILQLQNLHFIDNSASNGGAFFIDDSSLNLLANDNDTSSNECRNNVASQDGGFLYAFESTIEIEKLNYINNSASKGGAFYISDSSTLNLFGNENSVIYNNKATIDGGFISAYDNSIITIDNYMFFNNTVSNSSGGGSDIFLVQDSSLTLKVRDDPMIPTTFVVEGNSINML